LPILGHAASGFASSAASRASHNSQQWPDQGLVAGTASEGQRGRAPSDNDGTVSGSAGSMDHAGLSAMDRGDAGVDGGASAGMCETWLVTELCDRCVAHTAKVTTAAIHAFVMVCPRKPSRWTQQPNC
jgi:hypothetical protein